MKKIISIFFIFISCQLLAQTRDEIIEEFKRERQKMMQEVLKMFESHTMNDSFFDMSIDSFGSSAGLVKVEKIQEEDGSISVFIKPKNKKTQLDIQTLKDRILIKSETKVEESGSSFQNFSSSSYSQTIAIPQGYIAESPVPENDALKIVLRPASQIKKKNKVEKKKTKPELVPIGKSPGEETL